MSSANPSDRTKGSGRRSRRVIVLVVAAAIAAGAAAWWVSRRPEAAPVPPLPAGVEEPEVAAALAARRDAVAANPRSAEAWGDYAMLLLAQVFYKDSDFCFAEAEKLAPSNPQWVYGRAQIALRREPEEAPGLLRQTIAVAPPGSEYASAAKFTLAELLLERGEVDGAAKLFTEELGPPPGNPRALLGLGAVALARGEVDLARRYLGAVRNDPHARKQATAYLARLAGEGRDEAAARRLERESADAPVDLAWPDPLLDQIGEIGVGRRNRDRRTEVLERQGMFLAAATDYLSQLETERTPRLLLGAGVNLLRLREFDRALPLLREAVELAPDSPQAQYTLALALFTRAEQESLSDPGSARAKEWLREAGRHAKRAAELKPDHGPAFLFWGLSFKLLGEPASAVEPLRRGLVARPDDFELHLALGQVLAATGDPKAAEVELKAARELNPDDPRPAQELEKLKAKK